jgi:hypothetical protein
MELIFTFLKNIPLSVYLLLAIVALSGGVYYYHNSYEQKVTDYAVLSDENKKLKDTIKSDSDAVAQLAAESKAREDAAKAALAAAQKKLKNYTTQANNILLATPQGANLCLSADFLFNDYIGAPK